MKLLIDIYDIKRSFLKTYDHNTQDNCKIFKINKYEIC